MAQLDKLTEDNRSRDDALMPTQVRHVVYAFIAGLLALTGYLFHVRGVAFMYDLTDRMISAFCN